MVGEKKYRIWRVYLVGCAHAFETDRMALFQVVCHKAGKVASTLPWSRCYIYTSPRRPTPATDATPAHDIVANPHISC